MDGSPPPGPQQPPGLTPPGPIGRFVRRLVWRAYEPFVVRGGSAPPRDLRSFLRWCYRGLEPHLLFMMLCSLTVGLTEVLIIDGVGRLIDRAAESGPAWFWSDHGGFLIWLLLLVAVVRPLAVLGQAAVQSFILNTSLASTVVWRLNRHSLGQSLSFFEADFAGRLAQKALQTGAAVNTITVDTINAVGILAAFMIGMTVSLFAVEPIFALIGVGWLGGYALALWATLSHIRAASKIRAERRSTLSGQLVDSFANIKAVKLFAHAGREEAATRRALGRYREAALEVGVHLMRLRLYLGVLNAALMAAAIYLPLSYWLEGQSGLGAVAASAMLAFRLTGMSQWIAFTLFGVFSELGAAEDGVETLSPPHTVTDPPKPRPASAIADASIDFDHVAFRYDADARKGPATLADFSLAIAPGEKVGLVGPSGAGKSTVVALLLRLYDVAGGAVRLGGVDVRTLAQDDLRRRIAVVTQETALFNRSALDNIRYGRPDATLEEAVEAARLAAAHDFLEGLEDRAGKRGYAAELGERGVRLSGGQRQRLALARAFLKDAPVLILDEATSALDSEVEADILAALPKLMRGKTVLAIAHRLSTLSEMDRLVVMKDGAVVESGSHDALIAQGGLYARLWARQSGGFLPRALEDDGPSAGGASLVAP